MRRSKAHALHPIHRVKQGLDNLVRYTTDPHGLLRFLGSSPLDYLPQTPVQDSHYISHRLYDFLGEDDVDLTYTWDRLKAGTGTELARTDFVNPEYAHASVETDTNQYDYYTYQEKYTSFELEEPSALYWVDRVWVEFVVMIPTVIGTEAFFGFAEKVASHPAYDPTLFGGIGGSLFADVASAGWRLSGATNVLSGIVNDPASGYMEVEATGDQPLMEDGTWHKLQFRYGHIGNRATVQFYLNSTFVGTLSASEVISYDKHLHLSIGIRDTVGTASKLWIRYFKYMLPKDVGL